MKVGRIENSNRIVGAHIRVNPKGEMEAAGGGKIDVYFHFEFAHTYA